MLCSYTHILYICIRMRLSVGSEYNGFVYIFLRGLTRLDDRLLFAQLCSILHQPTNQVEKGWTNPLTWSLSWSGLVHLAPFFPPSLFFYVPPPQHYH